MPGGRYQRAKPTPAVNTDGEAVPYIAPRQLPEPSTATPYAPPPGSRLDTIPVPPLPPPPVFPTEPADIDPFAPPPGDETT